MRYWESICSVLSQRYVRHTRHLLPVLNNFYLLVNTEFFVAVTIFQVILSSWSGDRDRCISRHNLYRKLIAYPLIESRNL
ncbi:MAG: hypothetical protein ACYTXI_31665 [Nostoc sp.]